MKKWVALIFLVATAFAQQTNQDFWPASPGLNLGKSNQRWNANVNNINISGTCTINGASCLGSGTITGATNNGGLVATGHTLGLLKTCSTGQILSWNGTAWACTSAGSGLPAGLDTQIQVNSSGGFGASPNFTFNLGTSTFSLSGTANISGPLTVTGALTNSALGPGGPFCVQETNGVFSSTGSACGSGGGSIGPGTTNKLTLWTSSTTVGNSDLTQSTGVSISTSDRIQINSNYLQASLTSATGCTIVNPALGLSNNPACYSVFGLAQLASGTNSSSGILAGLYGTSSSGIGTVTGSPYIVGVYGLATAGGTGTHSWVAGLVGQSNTNNIGTVAVSSGVVALGETGAFGSGGGSATLLDGLDAQIQIQHASETSARTAGVYVRSPVLTGASTHNYGLYIEDQTVGAGNNTDPWGIFEAGSAKNQLGGSLTLAGIVGSTQCLHVNSVGLISGTGADCGTGGGGTFPSGTGFAFVNASSSWASAVASTGTGNVVLSSNAVLVTPNLGTPSAIVLTNATGAPTWNQNTTGTSGGLTGCTQAAAGDVCVYTGSAWQVFTGNNSGTAVFQEDASGVPSWGSGASTTFQANGTPLSSASTVNFLNSSATNGLTLTFTNTSAGNVKLGYTGTLTNAGLSTSGITTVNSQTCTLGSTCTIPFQTNGNGGNTSQAGVVFTTSTTNSVGLTVTPVNSSTNVEKFEISGGSYTGNAAGLFGTPSITVNGITATTYNGGTMSGTFPGNPTFSGSPVFNMTGGPFCVQETAGVLSSTGVACGSGGGAVGPGTVNGLAYFNASSTVASVASTVEGQLVVFHHTGPPTAVSPSLADNGSGPIITSPYVIQCDSATTLLDRGTTIPFGVGASVVTIPDSTGSGCSGLAAILEPIGVSLTLNASGSDTFRVLGNGVALSGQTTVTITDGEYASINQSSAGVWTIRIMQGGSVTSVASGSGLTGGPITVSGTLSIANLGVTTAMINTNAVTAAKFQQAGANTVIANGTGSTANVQTLSVPTCDGNNQALQWTSGTGFKTPCPAVFGMLNVASPWTADQTMTGHLIISGHDVAKPLICADSSGSGTAQVCTTSPTFTPAAGDSVIYTSTSANSGAGLTINVNSLGAKSVAKWQTTTTLVANDLRANTQVLMTYDGTNWEMDTIGNGPSGSGTVTVVGAGNLTSTAIVTGGGTQTLQTPSATSTLSSGGNMVLAGTLSATAPTFSGAAIFSAAGVASIPGLTISGAPYTAGTSTTDFPQLYLNTTGASAVTSFSANGTFVGVNAPAAWSGNFIDFHLNGGGSLFLVGPGGSVTLAAGNNIGSVNTGLPKITFIDNGVNVNQPINILKTTNQIVTGTSTNLTTLNFPAPSGGVTLTFPTVAANMAAFDVAQTFSALQTFGSNISITGGTIAGAAMSGTFTGAHTYSGSVTFSAAGAASTPGVIISGTPFVGTTTTSTPQLYLNSGATCTSCWNNAASGGTVLGINAPTSFAGNFLDFHVNGTAGSEFAVTSAGSITVGAGAIISSLDTGSPSITFGTNSIALSKPITGGLSIDAITCGVASTTSCVITGNGSTSGTATLTWPAVAGTTTNAITSSNRISAPAFTSTVSTGTAPFVVTSTTNVANLNASLLNGATFAATGTIGGTTPAAATFTTITANTSITCTAATCLGSATATTQAIDTNNTTVATTAYVDRMKVRAIPFNFGAPEGSALSTNLVRYVTVPYACSITGWSILADAGTATVKFWKVATGTALPTVSNVISTSGVALSSGTAVRSSTVTDFTTTTVTAGDIIAATNTATSSAKFLQAELECSQ